MADLCTPSDMAKWFINRIDRESGESITHLKVQKLLYFAQSYYLANKGVSLFGEDFEAWTHGPVLPSVFKEYSGNRWEALPPADRMPELEGQVVSYLEAVYQNFAKFSAKELERITHQHDPWINARGDLPAEARCNNVIPKDVIKKYYEKRIKKAKKSR
ncbi:type II toxin-antitoxin system antitoxin SocA domain-containing protein [Fodinicurvata sp. EGI_FJ10296]|uniref:Panacea domain-containing protein n=1 Tax=Fodinicurvata sp. EGI_FJ10296 TaxID=3231908 RepID=UPI003451AB84